MTRRDRLALMSAIIYASRPIASSIASRGRGWENSPTDVADNLDTDVEHYLTDEEKEER